MRDNFRRREWLGCGFNLAPVALVAAALMRRRKETHG